MNKYTIICIIICSLLWGTKANNILGELNDSISSSKSESFEAPLGYSSPTNFSWLSEKPECIGAPVDQNYCGSCWAYATTNTFSDRYCIGKNGSEHIKFSVSNVLACVHSQYGYANKGCGGGASLSAWRYFIEKGAVSEWCYPYFSYMAWPGTNLLVQPCLDNYCLPFFFLSAKRYNAKNYQLVQGIQNMKAAIQQDGPIVGGMTDYPSFMTFKGNGIYQPLPNEHQVSKHVIEIIGWGVLGTDNYWFIKNTMGTAWGDHGFAKMKMEATLVDEVGLMAQPDYS